MLKGIDISYHQGNINFKKIKATNEISFIILRQGYRKTIDSKFIEYVKECKNNNIPIMVYHFIYTNNATIQENAESTVNNIKKAGLNPEEIWIAADLEYDTWKKNKETCTKEKCTKYTKEYLDALKVLGCKKLFIYTNTDYYKHYYDWNQLSEYPIWLADYAGTPDYPCAIQQYTSTGKVNGINGYVDMNYLFDETMLNNTNSQQTANNNIVLISNEGVTYTQPWDNRYNEERLYEAGINTYSASRIREYLDKVYNNPSANDGEDILSKSDKAKLVSFSVCTGKRTTDNESKDNSVECSEVLQNQKLGLLTLSDYLYASVDPNCKSASTKSCKNYNCLTMKEDWWLATANKEDTSTVFSVSRSGNVTAETAGNYAIVRPVIYLNSNVLFKSGNGTLEKPYKVRQESIMIQILFFSFNRVGGEL